MSTTLLPFLYQTRTLQRFVRTRVPTPAFQAYFHGTPRHNGRRRWPKNADNSIPFEKNPDHEPEGLSPGHRSTITPTERDAFQGIFEEIANRKASTTAPQKDNSKPANTSHHLPGGGSFLQTLFPQSQSPESNNLLSTQDETREFINVIVQDASQRSPKNKYDPKHPFSQIKNAVDPEKALLRFPPSLRRAAKLALGVIDRDRGTDDFKIMTEGVSSYLPQSEDVKYELDVLDDMTDNPLARNIAADAIRAVERKRVEEKMKATKTDFELWEVLEEEVFSMVEKLGISGDPTVVKQPAKDAKGKKTKKKQNEVAAAVAEIAEAKAVAGEKGENQMSMNIYGPLYPSYLLNALRLMDQSFERSSPLALNLLPRIKELGLMSFVLGVSTAFYNSLAGILWYRYGDARAVVNLLEEMSHVGLYCDGGTQGLIYRIQEHIESSKKGENGPFAKEVVGWPDYEFVLRARLRHWNKTCDRHLSERRADYSER